MPLHTLSSGGKIDVSDRITADAKLFSKLMFGVSVRPGKQASNSCYGVDNACIVRIVGNNTRIKWSYGEYKCYVALSPKFVATVKGRCFCGWLGPAECHRRKSSCHCSSWNMAKVYICIRAGDEPGIGFDFGFVKPFLARWLRLRSSLRVIFQQLASTPSSVSLNYQSLEVTAQSWALYIYFNTRKIAEAYLYFDLVSNRLCWNLTQPSVKLCRIIFNSTQFWFELS